MKDYSMTLNYSVESEEAEIRGTPERNMLMAVIERAILDFVGTNKKESEEAQEWLFDSDSIGEFSFDWVCRELDLDPVRVLKDIKSLPKRTNHHIAPWYMKNKAPEELAA